MMAHFFRSHMSGPHSNCIETPTVNIRGPSFHNIIMSFYDSWGDIASMGVFLHLVDLTVSSLVRSSTEIQSI